MFMLEIEQYSDRRLDVELAKELGYNPYVHEDGISWIDASHYSKDLQAAFGLIESLRRRGAEHFEMYYSHKYQKWHASFGTGFHPLGSGEAWTPARAIAQAAMRALTKMEAEALLKSLSSD